MQTQTIPTMYFIGVTTTKSSIMKIFPLWSDILGLGAQIVGHDIEIGASPEKYSDIVSHIKSDPLSMGALVTTHKIDLLEATRPMFDELGFHAEFLSEVSSISKREGKLIGHAKDPISSGLALEAFVPEGHWGATGAHVLCLGAGGAGVSISMYLATREDKARRPEKFTIVDINQGRLDKLKAIHEKLDTDVTFEYVLNGEAVENDRLMAQLPAGSLVINATGMGKDRPGSPLTNEGAFPQDGLIWELNYRGERAFMHQAMRQADERNLTVEDGWVYFLHGWTQVIAEVFDLALTPERFQKMDEAASTIRG